MTVIPVKSKYLSHSIWSKVHLWRCAHIQSTSTYCFRSEIESLFQVLLKWVWTLFEPQPYCSPFNASIVRDSPKLHTYSCNAIVNQSHPFIHWSSNDNWLGHLASRNARFGFVVSFFSSAIYYLFSSGRVEQFIQCFLLSLVFCWYCFDKFTIIIRKLVFVTICSQPVTHQSIHSLWPALYFVNLKKRNGEFVYARNVFYFPIFLSLRRSIVGLNRSSLLLSSIKKSIADRHQYLLV